jgi:hypothetical protein
MTDFTLSSTEDDVFKTLGRFLQDVLPRIDVDNAFEVIVGQENRVPEPTQPNYAVMTPLRMPRLSTNFEELAALGLQAKRTQAAQVVVQLDIHGPEAFNNSMRVSTLFRSSYGVEFFEGQGLPIAPLFADDPRQAQFVDGEKQYEDRYIIEANLQVNFTLTAITQSARELEVDLISVETDPNKWPNSTATATGS